MKKLKLKKNESFFIREGWIEKALNTKDIQEKNIFGKENGIQILGIGANMVRSLRYWLSTSNIISGKNNLLSEFGYCLLKYDPYLENSFSWWLIHGNIVNDDDQSPLFHIIFYNFNLKKFSRKDLEEYIFNYFKDNDIDLSNFSSAQNDIGVFLRMYVEEKVSTPEDNLSSPIGKLHLLKKSGKELYEKTMPSYNNLDFRIVYYFVLKWNERNGNRKELNIDDILNDTNSPAKIFNLDRNLFSKYLEDMKSAEFILLNRTAGLNTIELKKQNYTITELFKDYFKEDGQ